MICPNSRFLLIVSLVQEGIFLRKKQLFYTIIIYFLSGQFVFIATSHQCKKTFFFVTIPRLHSIHMRLGFAIELNEDNLNTLLMSNYIRILTVTTMELNFMTRIENSSDHGCK